MNKCNLFFLFVVSVQFLGKGFKIQWIMEIKCWHMFCRIKGKNWIYFVVSCGIKEFKFLMSNRNLQELGAPVSDIWSNLELNLETQDKRLMTSTEENIPMHQWKYLCNWKCQYEWYSHDSRRDDKLSLSSHQNKIHFVFHGNDSDECYNRIKSHFT